MALDKSTLVTALENIFNANVPNPTAEQTTQISAMANAWATAIDTYIKSATVTSVPVLTSPSGVVTGTITNTIS
jgi:hypothetical protein